MATGVFFFIFFLEECVLALSHFKRLATGTVRCGEESERKILFSSTNVNTKHFERSLSFQSVQPESTTARLRLGEKKKWNFKEERKKFS